MAQIGKEHERREIEPVTTPNTRPAPEPSEEPLPLPERTPAPVEPEKVPA